MDRKGSGKARLGLFRVVLGTAAGAVLAASLAAGTARAEDRELVIVATGGAFEKALKAHFYDPFTKATGIKVRAVPASNAEQWTKVKAMSAGNRVEWDIVTLYPEDMTAQAAVLAPIDCAAIPALADETVPGACQPLGLVRTIGAGVLTYDTKTFAGEGPKSWADFWDVKRFPGPRAFPNYGAPWWVLMAALEADGVPADKLFPLDLDRAFRKLDEIRTHVKVWWKTGDQSQQIMRDGEVVMAMMWSGRAYSLMDQGALLGVSWQGAPINKTLWGVLKGAPHPSAAKEFLAYFVTRPEAHLGFGQLAGYDTSNRKALDLLTPAERAHRSTDPANAVAMAQIDDIWVAQNRSMLLERWNSWLAN